MRILAAIIGALAGGLAGYFGGIVVACDLFQAGNLCGLVGVFITGPLGFIAGGITGALLGKSWKEK